MGYTQTPLLDYWLTAYIYKMNCWLLDSIKFFISFRSIQLFFVEKKASVLQISHQETPVKSIYKLHECIRFYS